MGASSSREHILKLGSDGGALLEIEGDVIGLDVGKPEYMRAHESSAAPWQTLTVGSNENARVEGFTEKLRVQSKRAVNDPSAVLRLVENEGLLEIEQAD